MCQTPRLLPNGQIFTSAERRLVWILSLVWHGVTGLTYALEKILTYLKVPFIVIHFLQRSQASESWERFQSTETVWNIFSFNAQQAPTLFKRKKQFSKIVVLGLLLTLWPYILTLLLFPINLILSRCIYLFSFSGNFWFPNLENWDVKDVAAGADTTFRSKTETPLGERDGRPTLLPRCLQLLHFLFTLYSGSNEMW